MLELLNEACELIAPHERDQFVIFGSAAIVLHGVDLMRQPSDLDLFVSGEHFSRLEHRFAKKRKRVCGERTVVLVPAPAIEILKFYPGVEFASVFANARLGRMFRGFCVGALSDLIKWKTSQGRRKDLRDLRAVATSGLVEREAVLAAGTHQ